jgi:Zn finger protein HypA/HybF involved in hydrogenase expression
MKVEYTLTQRTTSDEGKQEIRVLFALAQQDSAIICNDCKSVQFQSNVAACPACGSTSLKEFIGATAVNGVSA